MRLTLADEAATIALGAALSEAIEREEPAIGDRGMAIGLEGDLGAGKTTLVRALLRRSGIAGSVKSPTFAILEPYEDSRLHFYHFDFYRFKNPREFPDGGFEEYFRSGAVCLVEWPEKAAGFLPVLDLRIKLEVQPAGRVATLAAHTRNGEQCLGRLKTDWSQQAAAGN